ncbi:hypothetical protein D3C80_1147260 [compost metagenome]
MKPLTYRGEIKDTTDKIKKKYRFTVERSNLKERSHTKKETLRSSGINVLELQFILNYFNFKEIKRYRLSIVTLLQNRYTEPFVIC